MTANNFLSYVMHNIINTPQKVKMTCVGMNEFRVCLEKGDDVHYQTFISNYPKTLADFAKYIAKNNMGDWDIYSLDSYGWKHMIYPKAIKIGADWVVLA